MDLHALTNPRSVAVVGASVRESAAGARVVRNLVASGFDGTIYPINPNYSTVQDLACFPSLASLPGPVDAVFIAVRANDGPAVLDEAARHGVRAAVINASGYADGGPEGSALQRRLVATASAHQMAVLGPNTMGMINVNDRIALWPGRAPVARGGSVAIVTQSGSAAMVLSEDPRDLGIAYVITSGNEAGVTIADLLDHVVADDRVAVVLMFLETIRDPETFAIAAERAATLGKPVVVLKVGRTDAGTAAVAAHTGSLAGDDRVYRAFFRRHGVLQVDDYDELINTAALVAGHPSPPATPHVAALTLSGGESALVADLASTAGLSLPVLGDQTTDAIRRGAPSLSSVRNPLDAYGSGWDLDQVRAAMVALAADSEIGTVVPFLDATSSGRVNTRFAIEIAHSLAEFTDTGATKFVLVNNSTNHGLNAEVGEILATAGIPYLVGMRDSIRALARWARRRSPAEPAGRTSLDPGAIWRLADADEVRAYDILRSLGVPMTRCALASTYSEAAAAAADLGYPVAVKGVDPSLAHKARIGAVRVGVRDEPELKAAIESVSTALKAAGLSIPPAALMIQPMAEPGIELIVATKVVPAFGPIVVAGLGGHLVEALDDVSLRLCPVTLDDAFEMLEESRAGRALRGTGAEPTYDIRAAADAIMTLSAIATASSGAPATLELNPLIVHAAGRGAVAVDLLLER